MSQKEQEEKGVDGAAAAVVVVVVRASLHCEGCAHKVKRSLKKHFHGVEKVDANYASGKVTVVGRVDPAKVKERVEKKTKKPAHLLSPRPPKIHIKNSDEKKPHQINLEGTTFVLKTRVHCDKCVHKINKIIKKYEGVEEVGVDLDHDKITVKGKMDMKEMLPYLNTVLKRVVVIEPPKPPPTKDAKEDGQEKLTAATTSSGGAEERVHKPAEENTTTAEIEEVVNRMEYSNGYEYGAHTYDPHYEEAGRGYVAEYWNAPEYGDAPSPFDIHTPEMFSDENPTGCSVM